MTIWIILLRSFRTVLILKAEELILARLNFDHELGKHPRQKYHTSSCREHRVCSKLQISSCVRLGVLFVGRCSVWPGNDTDVDRSERPAATRNLVCTVRNKVLGREKRVAGRTLLGACLSRSNLDHRLSQPSFPIVHSSTCLLQTFNILQVHCAPNHWNDISLLHVSSQYLQILRIRIEEQILVCHAPPISACPTIFVGRIQGQVSKPW